MKIIDAEELIAKAQHEAEGMTEPFKSNFAVLVEWLIDKVQPIEPKPQWIPCSERLPEQYGNYLISIDGKDPDIGTINPNDPRGWSLCDANGFYWANDKALNITAWQTLPESYKG